MLINTNLYDFEVDAIYPSNAWDAEKGEYGNEPLLDKETGWRVYQLTVSAYEKKQGAAARPEEFRFSMPFEKEPELARHTPIRFESLGYYVNRSGRMVYQASGVELGAK